jgi:hypothetical protein
MEPSGAASLRLDLALLARQRRAYDRTRHVDVVAFHVSLTGRKGYT